MTVYDKLIKQYIEDFSFFLSLSFIENYRCVTEEYEYFSESKKNIANYSTKFMNKITSSNNS